MTQEAPELEYVGFWLRVWASIVDSILVIIITAPILKLVYGRAFDLAGLGSGDYSSNFLVDWVLPAVAIIAFWLARQATPGKMLISAKIVDARTGGKPTPGQAVVRYLGYYVSIFTLFLGFVWVGLDARKQGFHDKLAGTVVVRPKRHHGAQAVRFPAADPPAPMSR